MSIKSLSNEEKLSEVEGPGVQSKPTWRKPIVWSGAILVAALSAALAGRSHSRISNVPAAESESHKATSLAYIRRQYDNVYDWNKAADSKAQILLAVNGALVSLLGAVLIAVPDELAGRIMIAGNRGLLLSAVAGILLAASIACGIMASYSNLSSPYLKRMYKNLGVNPNDPATYIPEVMWWFGYIAQITGKGKNAEERKKKVVEFIAHDINDQFEKDALASQIIIVSEHALRKYRSINVGWVFYALGLVALIAYIFVYIVNIS